jgi:chaperonin GroES
MLVPLSNHVILKKKEQENTTKSGIVLASKEADNNTGIVESIGEDVKDARIVPGSEVIFKKYQAQNIKIDDQDYSIIEDKDILAIVK